MAPLIDQVRGTALRGVELLRAILDYARVGGSTLRREDVDLNEVLLATCADLRAAVDESQAVVDAGALPRVLGDRILLLQLLTNLVANALKYRGERPARIRVVGRLAADRVELLVEDDGIGIPEEDRERAFLIFERVGPRADIDGVGLGLATCRRIVELHGGTLVAEACASGGARLRFDLPKA